MIHILTNPLSRAKGAMFRRELDDDVLVFVYRKPGKRTFHTWFCPPLRITALDAFGRVLFDDEFPAGRPRGQIVHLPADTQIVVESSPVTLWELESVWNAVGGMVRRA